MNQGHPPALTVMGMAFFAPLFALGVWALQQQAALPSLGIVSALIILSLAASIAVLSWKPAPTVLRVLIVAWLVFILGFSWAQARAQHRLLAELPLALEGQTKWVCGHVASLPETRDSGLRFRFRPLAQEGTPPLPATLLVSWYAPSPRTQHTAKALTPLPTIKAGEHWCAHLRLRRPYGRANPGLADQEAWFFAQNIRATAQVRTAPSPPVYQGNEGGGLWVGLARFRQTVADRLTLLLADRPYAGVMLALSVGEQRAIDSATYAVFRATGVSHLVAISGLHISLVAGLMGGVCLWLWRRFPSLGLHCPAREAAVLSAMGAATAYAVLAGLGIPVQRALLMVWVAGFGLLARRGVRARDVLGAALFIVVLADPWAVLAPGFWLSFSAVAFLIFVMNGRQYAFRGLGAAVRAQWGLSVALIPLLIVFFGAFPLLSPLANAVAIPVVSFIVVPLLLAFIIIPWEFLLWAAHDVFAALMLFLGILAAWPWAEYRLPAPSAGVILLSLMGVLWLWLPKGTPNRALLGVAFMAPLFLQSPTRPDHAAFRAVVLDVGQGLAVHIQTQHQDWVFDAGPAWPVGDAGEHIVAPYLRAQGVHRLSGLIISHEDVDHSGGRASLNRLFEPAVRFGAWPEAVPHRACVAGGEWEVDGVRFEWLHPGPLTVGQRMNNEDSCVLRVSAGPRRLLLTGDAEFLAEGRMRALFPDRLRSEVVVAGHHGSRTSSGPAFVAATQAQAVIYAAGWRNPFRHPHSDVVARWEKAGARAWRTDTQGAIIVIATPGSVQILGWRDQIRRYWHSPRGV